jgi:hypothetical protein
MARKKADAAQKSSSSTQTKQPTQSEIHWPPISIKEGLECRELIPDQIYVIDVSVSKSTSLSLVTKNTIGIPFSGGMCAILQVYHHTSASRHASSQEGRSDTSES